MSGGKLIIMENLPRIQIITHSNAKTGEFFFSTNHCQGIIKGSGKTDLLTGKWVFERESWDDGNWVPCTTTLPIRLHSGTIVKDKADYIKHFTGENNLCERKEIPNPEPEFQA